MLNGGLPVFLGTNHWHPFGGAVCASCVARMHHPASIHSESSKDNTVGLPSGIALGKSLKNATRVYMYSTVYIGYIVKIVL